MKNKKFNRREFMTALAAGAGTVLLGNATSVMGQVKPRFSTDPFQTVSLGRSGIKTTLIGMGTGFNGYNRSSNITRAGKSAAETVIRYAYEKGIRFFDCADTYGTHPYTKDALKDFPRESYVLGTKIWLGQGGLPETERPGANITVDRFRKELNTDYIDLVQIHCMTAPDWKEQYKKHLEILENLKAKKVIRAHGVSVHSLEAMETSINPWIDVVHVRINPYGENMDRKDPSEVTGVIERLHKSGKGVIGMKLIGGGKFKTDTEKIEKSLKYVLSLGTVDMIIVGFEFPGQIDNYTGKMEKVLCDLN